MDDAEKSISLAPKNRIRRWVRALGPLLLWLLMAVFLAIKAHQRLIKETRVYFRLQLPGQPADLDSAAHWDGRPIGSGENVSLGWHTFTVSNQKVEPFMTRVFIWYGSHNLGLIGLRRAKGTLAISAVPAVPLLSIRGPEFELVLTNSTGTNVLLPTDRYEIDRVYSHWKSSEQASVSANSTTSLRYEPAFGTLRLGCNQTDASFQLLDRVGQLVEAGNLPVTVSEVPEGSYTVVALHHRMKVEKTVAADAGRTNSIEVPFLYGAVRLESEPSGATVVMAEGQNLGVTPLFLSGLAPGRMRIEMRLAGYSSATGDVEVTALETNTFRANLVSLNYSRAMGAARQYLADADYDQAFKAAAEALEAKANDADALAVEQDAARKRQEAEAKRHVQQAEALGNNSDYIAAVKELETALQLLPDNNDEAKQLASDFKKWVPEQIERLRAERAERGKKRFDDILVGLADAALFESHEITTAMPVERVQAAILEALKIHPEFRVTKSASNVPETFEIEAVQDLMTALATSAGRRECEIVCSQTRDDETQILFKIIEYKAEAVNKFSIGALIHAPSAVTYVPIHASRIPQMTDKMKAQLEEGQKMVMERIQQAIGGDSGKK